MGKRTKYVVFRRLKSERLCFNCKKYLNEEFIRFWGEMSIPLEIQKYGFIQRNVEVMLSAWEIPDMIYTSICESNDHRNGHMTEDMAGHVANLYRGFESDKSGSLSVENVTLERLFAYMVGITYEQFEFQNLA